MWPPFSLKFQNRLNTVRPSKNFQDDATVKIYDNDQECKFSIVLSEETCIYVVVFILHALTFENIEHTFVYTISKLHTQV